MPDRLTRRAAAAALTGTLALGGVAVAAGPASAKSEVSVATSSSSLRLGQTVRITATGGDDSVRYTVLCVDHRVGGVWRQLGCGPNNSHRVGYAVRATQRGTQQYRARLLAMRFGGRFLTVDRISGTASVLVH
jgi:hypothetical protein